METFFNSEFVRELIGEDSEDTEDSLPRTRALVERGLTDNIIFKLIEERANEFGVSLVEELKVLIPLAIWRSFTPEQIQRIQQDAIRFAIVIGMIFVDSENRPKNKRTLGHIINAMEFEGALAILKAKNVAKGTIKSALKGALETVLGTGFSALFGI